MPLLPQPELDDSFGPYVLLRQHLGLVPCLFRAQSLLPRLIDAEVPLVLSILAAPGTLSGRRTEPIDLAQTTALARFQDTLATGLGVEPGFDGHPVVVLREYAPYVTGDAFAFFEDQFGFVPSVFRAQTLRPEVLQAEAGMVESVLLTSDALSRVQKEYILLAVSAANLNAYFVTLHSEILKALGVAEEVSDQIAIDHRHSDLAVADKALIDFAVSIARGVPPSPLDLDGLRRHGFDDRQVLEAIAMASLTNFLNTLQAGLGAVPDFPPRRDFVGATSVPTEPTADPDAELVAVARGGNTQAFEELVRRHHRRVYRTALCVTGNHEDAEDAAQVTFVKAFQNLATFEHHARFTTWLTRIAINEALARVRGRRPMENLSLEDENRQEFRPALVAAWVDDPEQLYAREELRVLIERALAEIPVRYRMAVLLRDIEQLSNNEAASALGLPVPTLKKHLMRGRLMLRESLAPHFVSGRGAVARV